MPPDASATKKRLLEAAYAEFAEHGLAGGRIDRISEVASANKRLIYVYFENKDKLFETVIEHSIALLTEAVPFTPEDLPGYAGALFDHLIDNPQHLRLALWSGLERPVSVPLEKQSYQAKVAALAAVRPKNATEAAMDPTDVLAFTLGLTTAWLSASPALRELSEEEPFSPERLAKHRSALVAAVRALVDPASPGAAS